MTTAKGLAMAEAIKTIGFVGLGTMGGPMARNLIRAGFTVRAYDINSESKAALARDGAVAVNSPAEAAQGADCTITMVPDSPHVEEALLGTNGIVQNLRKGAVHIEMSTIAPAATDRFIAALAERGIDMVDAQVGRSPQHAAEGKLLIMAGATAAALERVRPVLQRLGDTIVHCGPPGMGSRMKIVNNFMSVTINVTTAEALTLAERSGLDPELARNVMLGTTAGQGHMSTTYPAKVLRGDHSPGFMIDLAFKDLGLALDLAKQVGVPVPTAQAARPVYERARQEGHGREDWSALYAFLRNERAKT
jgi:4-hydroxybutyrate dehydrogenase/sulfolactaldehyde 3-reductase